MVNKTHDATKKTSKTAEKDKMVDYVVTEFERYERAHSDRFEKARAVYKDWLGEPTVRDETWQNQVHVPVTFEAEQTVSPRIFAALFPSEAPIELKAEGETPEESAIGIKSLLQHHFRLSDVDIKGNSSISQTSLLGTGYLYAPWKYCKKWQVDPQTGERYMAVVDNRPDCEVVDFFELYPHPAKIYVDDELPLIRRRFCDAEYLKKMANMPQFKFQNLADALNSPPSKGVASSILDEKGQKMELKDREEYELLEYWGGWDESYVKDDGKVATRAAVPYWIMVINRTVKVRAVPNPYNHQKPPFIKTNLYGDLKKSWFGIGMGQVGKPTQDRLNKIVNQRLDNVDLVLNKQGVYNGNDPLINTRKLRVSKPGQFHKVSDINTSIDFLDTPDVTASSYKEEEIAKQDYRESTGASAPLMPADKGQHRTASGMNLLQSAAGARFKPILRKMEVDLIRGLGMIYLSNLQQFMAVPELVQMVGEDKKLIRITPEAIQAKTHFLPSGLSEMMNKEQQIGQYMRFKEISMNDPTINRAVINKRIAKLMGLEDLDELIIDQSGNREQGGLPPDVQERIKQRLAEGADPETIKMELLGQPPDPNADTGGGQ